MSQSLYKLVILSFEIILKYMSNIQVIRVFFSSKSDKDLFFTQSNIMYNA